MKMKRVPCMLVFGWFMACGGSTVLQAQTAATIVGTVKDQDGHPVSGAVIEGAGQKSATRRKVLTDRNGDFVLAEIPPDSYEVSATCGTCNDVSSIVEIGAGQTRSIGLGVDTRSASTEISVDTRATTIDSASAELGFNITALEIGELPLNGHTFAPLALTAPLASNTGGASFLDIRFGGQTNQQNRYLLDGADLSTIINTTPNPFQGEATQFRLRASLESIQEFRLNTFMYPADEGFATGGQIKLVSKTGSNEWHGDLFEFFRNDRLDASNFFDLSGTGALRMNQFGGSLGGALKKNKIFVFAGFEDLRQAASKDTREAVPSGPARTGADPAILLFLKEISSGQIPTADPSVNLAASHAVATQNETNLNVKLDFLASMKNRLFVRFSRAIGTIIAPDETTTPRAILATALSDDIVTGLTSEIGPQTINTLNFSFNRVPTSKSQTGSGDPVNGIRALVGNSFGTAFASPGGLIVMPNGDYGQSIHYDGRSYEFTENLDVLFGSHSIKVGVDVRAIRLPMRSTGGTTYRYLNADAFLVNYDADVTYSSDLVDRVAAREQLGVYAQDQWRLHPNLTISAGLRYEFYTPTREKNDRAEIFNYSNFSFTPAHGGFYRTSKLGFDPRLAMTWSPAKSKGGTVFRVGAGIYQGPPSVLDTVAPIQNDARRVFLPGSSFPQSVDSLLNSPELETLPYALDVSSFRKPQRNIEYSASVQQAIRGGFVGQIVYAGSLNRHLVEQATANLATGVETQSGEVIRPADLFGPIKYLTNGGTSAYNALQIGLSRRFVDNLTVSESYTWSHSIGDSLRSGGLEAAQDPTCLRCERADNDFDVRQNMSVNAVYSLPLGKNQRRLNHGVRGIIASGWALSGVWNARSGIPINVLIERPDEIFISPNGRYYSPYDTLPIGSVATTNVPFGGEDRPSLRPNLVPGVSPHLKGASGLWLNPLAFAIPQPGTYGNLGRNALRGPAFSQIDFQVSRDVHLGEHGLFKFRAEVFNVLNRPNFANPASTLTDALVDVEPGSPYTSALAPGFGILNSTVGRTVGLGTSRQIQLSGRYEF